MQIMDELSQFSIVMYVASQTRVIVIFLLLLIVAIWISTSVFIDEAS